MSLNLLTCNINNNDISIPIDKEIELLFSAPLEKFSIVNGISIYSIGAQTWTGSMMSQMDSKTSDVKSSSDQINIVEYSYTISGANVYIKPNKHLEPKTKYYIQLAPGSDPERFITKSTFDEPVYNYTNNSSNGILEIVSPFKGNTNCVYVLTFNSSTNFDISIDGLYAGSYSFKQYEEFKINKELNVSINGIFNAGDTVTVNCYAPVGLSTLIKITFVTSEYIESTVKSTNIEDKLYSSFLTDFKVVSTIPSSLSVNNTRINPIIIKFNRSLNDTNIQNIVDKVRIFKLSFDNGSTKKINFYPQVKDNILKLYLISVDSLSEISTLPLYEVVDDSLSISDEYKLIKETTSFKIR
jgi:hypothetical protein